MRENMNELIIIDNETIQNKIFTMRDTQVMLDRDLAELYGVETKHINQAVRNNQDKFQEDFFFELTANYSKTRVNPKAFTEQGVYMLATILKSKTASQTTVLIKPPTKYLNYAIIHVWKKETQEH